VHVLVNHKYVGHLVAILAYLLIAMASLFGIEHNLLIYGAGPGWDYTEMRGFGHSLSPWLWFKLYWSAWAIFLAVAARLLWVRGKESSLRVRLQLARKRFTTLTTLTFALAILSIVTLGGFIFYNTNVLNDYMSTAETRKRSARYEQTYGRYANAPKPVLTGVRLYIEIHPGLGEADIRGTYRLVNRSSVSIDSIHVAVNPDVETKLLRFSRHSELVTKDNELSYQIYALKKSLQSGDSLQLKFVVHAATRGFRESGANDAIVSNGTAFNSNWLPRIGYQTNRELISAGERRKHSLPARPLIASLYDKQARKNQGGKIDFDAIVGTSKDQVAVAPGALRRTWTKTSREGKVRRYFHYSSDSSIGLEWPFFSARYAVHKEIWNPPTGSKPAGSAALALQGPVTIQIYYHPEHTANVDRMTKSIRASLEYYSKTFGPYRYSHLTFVERPANGTGMHADPGLITFTEGTSYWNPKQDRRSVDLPFAVVAHEMAHQWTVPYAAVEGGPVMSESLAWYYAMKVVEKSGGPQALGRLLHFMRQPHPIAPIRRGEPLLQGLDKYLSYRRGPFALYTLSQYIGEKPINEVLRRLLEKHRQPNTPLATTLDLYRELESVTPDSLKYLPHDLFKVNTYWDLKTEQATMKQNSSGDWQVTLDVKASKSVFDRSGSESDKPMKELVEVGVFGGNGKQENSPLYLKKHLVKSGRQRITVNVKEKPSYGGIDPNNLLIDLNAEDNIKAFKMNETKLRWR